MKTHLLEKLADPNSRRVRRHQEGADPYRSFLRPDPRKNNVQAGVSDIGDEDFGPVQDVAITVPARAGLQRRRIRPRSRLRQRKGAQQLYQAYQAAGLTFEQIDKGRYARIAHIRGLISAGKLTSALRWAEATEMVAV